MTSVRISDHAIDAYAQRIVHARGAVDKERVRQALEKILSRATRITLSGAEALVRLINNGFRDAEYYEDNGTILVVTDGTLVTCYANKRGERY